MMGYDMAKGEKMGGRYLADYTLRLLQLETCVYVQMLLPMVLLYCCPRVVDRN